ncbi:MULTISPECIES: hypothetical protein [unclassified Mesorhizobium]|uniref:hypothetical protein n=1 Tax=unclassified Mesorhizobium TaxID=325217 RepID=UPI0016723B6F|nr:MULTISPECIES: hypothetical protein [unclassified Mesorhizobium]
MKMNKLRMMADAAIAVATAATSVSSAAASQTDVTVPDEQCEPEHQEVERS